MKALVLAMLLVPQASLAALISVDVVAPGDALATLDTDTGLEWLDLSQTLFASPDDLLGGAGGWLEQGWRFATVQEACALIAGNVASLDPCPDGFVQFFSNPSGVDRFIALFGATFDFEGATFSAGLVSRGGSIFEYAAVGNAAASFEILGVPNQEFGLVSSNISYVSSQSSPDGIFLVRAIPEPSTALLLSLGIAGCCLTRRCSGPGSGSNQAASGILGSSAKCPAARCPGR